MKTVRDALDQEIAEPDSVYACVHALGVPEASAAVTRSSQHRGSWFGDVLLLLTCNITDCRAPDVAHRFLIETRALHSTMH